jgi:hypothetical protein
MRRLGNSIDWSRERFTMDEGLSNAVTEVFVRLHRGGPDLPRQAAGQLGPGAAHRGLRSRGAVRGGTGLALALPLPAGRRLRAPGGGDDPPRDHARRHRGRRAPGGRTLSAPDRAAGRTAADRPHHPGDRGRLRRSRVRHRLREDHPRARLQRQRRRRPPRPAPDQHLHHRRPAERERPGGLPGAGPLRGAPSGSSPTSRRWGWSTRSPTTS